MTSTLKTNAIEPEGATTTLNVGRTGKNVIITDNLKANVLKDAGANAVFTSNGSGVLSGVNSGFGSAQVLLSTTTVSSAVADVSIIANIDSTYKEYVVEMVNVVPASDNVNFQFQFGSGGGPSYGLTKTTTNFAATHNQGSSTAGLAYQTSGDLAQSTNPQQITWGNTPNNDAALSGWLHLFDPASTTYVKQFYLRTQQKSTNPRSQDQYVAGYANTTTAITAIQFTMTSGNITAGTFKLYGIK